MDIFVFGLGKILDGEEKGSILGEGQRCALDVGWVDFGEEIHGKGWIIIFIENKK